MKFTLVATILAVAIATGFAEESPSSSVRGLGAANLVVPGADVVTATDNLQGTASIVSDSASNHDIGNKEDKEGRRGLGKKANANKKEIDGQCSLCCPDDAPTCGR